ncbi:MAG: YciI family protein [Flavobacteriaceae bacterium]
MNEELSTYEKQLFRRLERDESPPALMEARIIEKLKSHNLITTKKANKMNTAFKWIAAAAAAVTLFFFGNYTGKQASAVPEIDPTKAYMLILHEDERFTPGDPQEMYQEYARWMENTMSKGIAMTGNELSNTTSIVDQQQKVTTPDPNSAITTGYFLMEVNSLEAALEVAKGNPHIKYGGTIEVKQIIVR